LASPYWQIKRRKYAMEWRNPALMVFLIVYLPHIIKATFGGAKTLAGDVFKRLLRRGAEDWKCRAWRLMASNRKLSDANFYASARPDAAMSLTGPDAGIDLLAASGIRLP